MASRSEVAYVGGLLALTAVFGALAVYSVPDGAAGIGIWPVALATAPLLVTRRPSTPLILGAGLRGRLPHHLDAGSPSRSPS